MVKRKKIALVYAYSEGWIGGSYYIQSLVNALMTLEEAQKPELIIICKTDDEFHQLKDTGYPYITKWDLSACNFQGNFSIPEKIINKIFKFVFKKNLLQKAGMLNYPQQIDVIFPASEFKKIKEVSHNLFWVPDFQELHLPQFFDAAQLNKRKAVARYIAESSSPVVFSSNDAQKDFANAYPQNKCKKFVIPFAVTHPNYRETDCSDIIVEHNIVSPYFFAPNQFWMHKDHITIIKAAKYLIEKKITNFQVLFSGKEDDFRNPDYASSLKEFVAENDLSHHIKFLGFIDRKKQLSLMNNAVAIIQPSLFEGWSTVIEDAKAMNQRIIASDLEVHNEQLNDYKSNRLFKRSDAVDLSTKMEEILRNPFDRETKDYNLNRINFGKEFMEAVNTL